MKRIIALFLALLISLTAAALADDMIVVNCDEWVSLRKSPDTASQRLMKVPLYETVRDCQWVDGKFVRCTYQGVTGYILNQYLEPLEPDEAESVMDEVLPEYGMDILAIREYDNGERMLVTGYASSGAEVWSFETRMPEVTELNATGVFLAGTKDDPRVMVYNSGEGLYSLNLFTGEVAWLLKRSDVNLGAGITHAADADGTMSIAGYYGPDPVCIDADGRVKWRSSAGSDDIYWPYEIAVEDRGIVTRYAMMKSDGETEGCVIYDKADGHVIGIEYDGES